MVQGYYTLEEAAQILSMPADELNQMRERKEIRAFADRGTWRFRTQDIEEIARRRGMASDPELPIREPIRKTPADGGEVFHFPLGVDSDELPLPPLPDDSTEEIPIGRERTSDSVSARKADSKSGSRPRTPPPSAGSDSDVRLIADGSDLGFQIAGDSGVNLGEQSARVVPPSSRRRSTGDSDVRMEEQSARVPPSRKLTDSDSDVRLEERSARVVQPSSRRRPDSDSDVKLEEQSARVAPKGRRVPTDATGESGVRLVSDPASDSDVKIIPDSTSEIPLGQSLPGDSGTESDVRLDLAGAAGSKRRLDGDSFLTEEIDLDAEIRKAEEAARAQQRPETRPAPKIKGKTPPPASPFELSEVDLHMPTGSSSTEGLVRKIEEDSSDFDLTLDPSDGLSPLEPSSGEVAALGGAEDGLAGSGPRRGIAAGDSGINLEEPSDAGISLENEVSAEDIDFELDVQKPKSSRSTKSSKPDMSPDSSSEFELTLDDSVRLAHEENVPTDSVRIDTSRMPKPGGGRGAKPTDSGALGRGDSAPLAKGDSSKRAAKGKPNAGRGAKTDSARARSKPLDSMRIREDSARLADSERVIDTGDESVELRPAESAEDIFETDFEVPALEGESGSQVVPLDESDTDLESSDFDLALSDEDVSADSDSGSQVVPLEEEEDVDEGAATIAKQRQGYGDDLESDEVEGEEQEARAPARRVVVPAAPADWGVFAPVTLMVSTLFMFFVVLMSVEFMNGMWGFHQPTKSGSIMIKAFGSVVPGIDSKDLERD
jgi:hypothetical protein